MRKLIEKLIINMSNLIKKEKAQLVYLTNSYDIILNEFITHNVDCKDGVVFHSLLEKSVSEYVELEIVECFGKLIKFIKTIEPLLSKSSTHLENKSKIDTNEMELLSKYFEDNWKTGISRINDNIIRDFLNFKTGMVILRKVLTQLLLYYSRFQNSVYLCFKNPPFRNSLVSNQVILYEIRKISKDF